MSKFDELTKTARKTILAQNKGPKPYDTEAVVTGVKNGEVWVHIPNGVPETPAQMGVNVKEGDKVLVRISNNRATVIGNLSSPPTDNSEAEEAHRQAKLAYDAVKNVSEEVTAVNDKVDDNAEQMAQTVIQINSDIEGLQEQIDGNITSWFYAVDPTLNNPPAIDWLEEGTEAVHLGDLYYNTETGYAWRWMYDGDEDEYGWMRITDVDVVKALTDAAKAQDTADSKRRVFYAQPVPPYDLGDLWVQGETGDILRCATAKVQGQLYALADWVKASKYTDDSKANQALQRAGNAEDIAEAQSQYFWSDTDGVHVASEAETPAAPRNMIMNSLGMLFRKGLNNILGVLTGTNPRVVIYDGEGNAEANEIASFGATQRIGKLSQDTMNLLVDTNQLRFRKNTDILMVIGTNESMSYFTSLLSELIISLSDDKPSISMKAPRNSSELGRVRIWNYNNSEGSLIELSENGTISISAEDANGNSKYINMSGAGLNVVGPITQNANKAVIDESMIQSGTTGGTTVAAGAHVTKTVSFSFSSAPRVTCSIYSDSTYYSSVADVSVWASNVTATGCTIHFYNKSSRQLQPAVHWVASLL